MKNIGFIGFGNMGRAICQGFLAAGAVRPENLFAFAPHSDKLRAFAQPLGVRACDSPRELLENCDTVILAVKPYIIEGVLQEQFNRLDGKVILSVVMGYTCQRMKSLLPASARFQYIMPNTPCMVGAGMLLFEEENTLTDDEHRAALKLFAALGQTQILPTRLMAPAMAISGCGPAFVAMMIEALADAGVKYGLPRDAAYRLASQTALGTGKMQLETGLHPGVIKDGVCSPAGTTIRGVEALEVHGMRRAFMEAIKAVLE